MKTKLGKIQNVSFGRGGYQDAMMGISFTLEGDGWGVGDFWGYWSCDVPPNANWTDKDRLTYLGAMVIRINRVLTEAKVDSIDRLKGVPIEVSFDGNTLTNWRVLKEVL